MSEICLNSIERGRNLERLAELDQIRLSLVHLILCQRLLSLSQALLLVGNKVAETPNEAIGGLYSRQLRKITIYIRSVHTFAGADVFPVTVPGAGEEGAASEALAASSAAGLAATAGVAGPGVGWEEGVAVPLVVAFLRAPGGTYALAPRTTAEYLRRVSFSRCEQIYGIYLSSSPMPSSGPSFI